jgi:hypothetical protein
MTHQEALTYKYVVDVDGNAWSARFKRLLTSGSLIFKATIMRESLEQPWEGRGLMKLGQRNGGMIGFSLGFIIYLLKWITQIYTIHSHS